MGAALYDWLLFFHILAAMIWLGGLLTMAVLAFVAMRTRDADAVARFVRTLPVIGPRLYAPAVVALLGFGIWLVLDSDAWAFDQTWIGIGLALFIAAFIIGAAFLSRAAIGAQRALDAADLAGANRSLTRWAWGVAAIVALLVVATWDMVFKPGF